MFALLYRFEGFFLDTSRRELRLGSGCVAVEPQVFDLLEFLIRARNRVVSRDDLFAAISHGRIVSEATLSSRVNSARAAIGGTGASAPFRAGAFVSLGRWKRCLGPAGAGGGHGAGKASRRNRPIRGARGSRFCPSPTPATIPTKTTSLKGWLRKSSSRCPAAAGCPLSPETPRSFTGQRG